ncbi:hypothetical protein [Microlunatus sp. Gsoil 973]|uniref:hypothetical protein n=1 Tax=Microlunatus sp. Gsoil 973 TaxID=2672569 RepID=UPI0018A87E1B|nr:hypothetical protein [Microlunatus sp. Gsoil 973]
MRHHPHCGCTGSQRVARGHLLTISGKGTVLIANCSSVGGQFVVTGRITGCGSILGCALLPRPNALPDRRRSCADRSRRAGPAFLVCFNEPVDNLASRSPRDPDAGTRFGDHDEIAGHGESS